MANLDEIGLSPPACLRRMRRLRETGAVRADVAPATGDPNFALIRDLK